MNIRFLDRFSILKEKEDFDLVKDNISKGATAQGTNLWILFFAILIASLGLNLNSAAVVIGAMLISPLIGPIVGVGFGTAINDLSLIRIATRSYLFSTIVGLLASTIYFLLSPLNEAHSEILSRTQPSVYDVLIAFFGGFAGIIAMSSKQKGNVIPGVAIATAIMPPLCTAGYGLATLQFKFFLGAFYLFIINSVFIFTATLITTNLLKYPVKKYDDPKAEKKENRITLAIIIITLLPSLYLGYDLVAQNRFNNRANRFIDAEVKFPNDYLLQKEIEPKKKKITLVFGGQIIEKKEIDMLKSKLKYYDLENVSIEIKYGFSFVTDNKSEELNQIWLALEQIEDENTTLKKQLDSVNKAQKTKQKDIYRELRILYPHLKEAIIQPVVIISDTIPDTDSAYFISLTMTKKLRQKEEEQLHKWLEERIDSKRIILSINNK